MTEPDSPVGVGDTQNHGTALGDGGNTPGPQVGGQGGAAGTHPVVQVDKPDAVGPTEQDAPLLAELLEPSLHLAAVIAHFREPARRPHEPPARQPVRAQA